MNTQTEELLAARVGIRLKLSPLDKSASDEEVVERIFGAWHTGFAEVSRSVKVAQARMTGDHGDMEVEEDRSIVQTLWFEREGRDFEKDELVQLQTLFRKAMQTAADEKGVLCTPLSAKYVRRVDHLTFEDLGA
jgi:hypothetical protein